MLFVVPGLVQLVLDPIVFVLSDRFGPARAVRCRMAVMAMIAEPIGVVVLAIRDARYDRRSR